MSDYEKLEFIHFAIQEALREIDSPELENALLFVEDIREQYLKGDE